MLHNPLVPPDFTAGFPEKIGSVLIPGEGKNASPGQIVIVDETSARFRFKPKADILYLTHYLLRSHAICLQVRRIQGEEPAGLQHLSMLLSMCSLCSGSGK